MEVNYISITQVLAIHDRMIKRFGGTRGIRDMGLLESAVSRPQAGFANYDLYKTIFDKAAVLLQSLVKNHPFVDGNKRTAFTYAGIFLRLNGYNLRNYHTEAVEFTVKVANQSLDIQKIARWLQDHSVKS